jgi:hypothetical protein
MKVHNHQGGNYRHKIIPGHSHLKKTGQSKAIKKPALYKSVQAIKKFKPRSSKKSGALYRFDPWWLRSIYPLKAIVVPFSVPVPAGTGDTVLKKGGTSL